MRKRSMLVVATVFVVGVALALALSRAEDLPALGGADAPEVSRPSRILSMSPNVTECIFALGLGDRVVGISDWTMYPPEARTRRSAGSAYDPNEETILAIDPDLVIVLGEHPKVARLCEREGYPFLRVRMDRLPTIYSGLATLGEGLGAKEEAAALADTIRWGIEGVERSVAGRRKPKVFLCMGREPGRLSGLSTVSREALLSELLDVAGGENVFADASIAYPRISKEALLRRAPDVILEIRPGDQLSEARRRQLRADWNAMPGLPAVRDGHIYFLTENHLLIPGPRVVLAARRMAMALHPEAFE
ncbi:MAG: helical backbone metal receptor [Candidatus Brocadiia bacterium]|nr:helical backbone metal receptor [Candidatus Brocadiia bacterium]